MKKDVFILAAAVLFCIASATTVLAIKEFKDAVGTDSIEALAAGKDDETFGPNITCHCSRLKTGNCAVNNWGSVCAGGINIHCDEWNTNCN